MKISFVSNYYNHHQQDLAQSLVKATKGDFFFISTSRMGEERKKLGYKEQPLPPFVKTSYASEESAKDSLDTISASDVVIVGSAPDRVVKEHIKSGKLTFRYEERPLKHRPGLLKWFKILLKKHYINRGKRSVYMLCASAYTPLDYAGFGLFKGRTYKWGYFPEVKRYDDISSLINRKDPTTILWCGRLLDWKHPDEVIKAAAMLKEQGYRFTVELIGCGEMEQELRSMAEQSGLTDTVRFLGSMPPEKVREHMERAGIYLFTSDRKEGWGAVLNEAMNSGCAVVAGHLIGSVPYLLKDGENGSVYRTGDTHMLYSKIKALLDDPERQKQLGAAAYNTITEEWNAKVAAERLVQLAEVIRDGQSCPELFSQGPCSRAEVIKEEWEEQ